MPDIEWLLGRLISVRSEVQLLPGPSASPILATTYPVARISFCDVVGLCPVSVPLWRLRRHSHRSYPEGRQRRTDRLPRSGPTIAHQILCGSVARRNTIL